MANILFHKLRPEEEKDFKAYAHDTWEYGKTATFYMHHVTRQEWVNMQAVATAIDSIYRGIAPDIYDDPMDTNILGSTLTIVRSALEPNMDAYTYGLWTDMPDSVQDTILTQTVKRYF